VCCNAAQALGGSGRSDAGGEADGEADRERGFLAAGATVLL
jgi:hypothetical protein